MKRLFIFLSVFLISINTFAQSPPKMSYQAVIRNSTNALVTSQTIGMRISILQGSESGTVVYTETQTSSTNANGLITFDIGEGMVESGTFSEIDWADGPYFIKTETDPAGGINYTLTGTSQLLSVPYALHATTAENMTGTINETDPVFNSSVAHGITTTDTAFWNNKLDSYIEADPVFVASVAASITGADTAGWNSKLDSYTETDPVYNSSVASGITNTDTAFWNNKLDSYTEADPVFVASIAASITGADTAGWNNKLDSYTETDPVFTLSVAHGITTTDTAFWNNKLNSYTETDPEVGSNTTNYISKWDGTSIVSSSIFDNGNIGVGTTSPSKKLDVNGDINFTGNLYDSGVQLILDGSETKITAGSNISVGGNGTTASPYTISVLKPEFYLGQDTLDGIVFFIYLGSDGLEHGLIVSKTESTAVYSGSSLVGANKTSNGAYNTNLMVSGAGTARYWVESLGAGWYLPSLDELSILWNNRYHVNNSSASGLTLINISTYWSSTEIAATNAISFEFLYGKAITNGKTLPLSVRAVKAF